MTITKTSQGTYSTSVAVLGETNSTAMIAAVEASIISGGWTKFDSYNLGTTLVFRCLNADQTTYKYLWIFFDTGTFKIYTAVYETWDVATHTGTNPAFTNSNAGVCSYSLFDSEILIMCSARWCLLHSFVQGQPSQWHGCVEIQREDPKDTAAAGYPCFAWVYSSSVIYPTLPRTLAGYTGISAKASGLATPYTKLTSGTESLNDYAGYAFDTSKRVVHSLRPVVGTNELHGRFYGLKGSYNLGSPYSVQSLVVDEDFNYKASGTPTDHWILGETVSKVPSGYAFSTLGDESRAMSVNSVTLSGNPTIYSCCYSGKHYWLALSNGVAKIDAASGLTVITLAVPGTATGSIVFDLIFDGTYVYATTATSVLRIDPVTDAVTVLALPLGGSTAMFDGTNLWVGARGQRVSNVVYKINPATFTITSTIVVAAANTWVCGMCSDQAGNIYVSTAETTVYKISSASVVTTHISGISNSSLGATAIAFDGQNFYIYVHSTTVVMLLFVYSLAGTLVQASTSVAQGTSSPVASEVSNARMGLYSYACGFQSNTLTAYSLLGVSASSSNTGIGTIPPLGTGVTSVFCDANRFMLATANGVFYVYTSLYKPDDVATGSKGRLLLPK